MATTPYNVLLHKRNSGTAGTDDDYDTLYPQTLWNNITDKPSTFTPSSHSHAHTDVSDWGTYINQALLTTSSPTHNNLNLSGGVINVTTGTIDIKSETGSWWQKLITADSADLTVHRLQFQENQAGAGYTELFGVDGYGNVYEAGTALSTKYAQLATTNTFSQDQTYSGYLKVIGTAAEHHLMTRGICGSTSDGSSIDNLYLQYGTGKNVVIGNVGQCTIDRDGVVAAPSFTENGTTLSGKYLGISGTAANSTLWAGYTFSDYLNQAVKSTSSPSFYAVSLTPSDDTTTPLIINHGTGATGDAIKYYLNGVEKFVVDAGGQMEVAAPTNSAGTEQATATFATANGGQLIIGKEGPNSGTMLRFDQSAGTTRLLFRSSATAGAMIWNQPETGSALYLDVDSIKISKSRNIEMSSGLIKPVATGGASLGTSSYKWSTIYGKSIYGDTLYNAGTAVSALFAPIKATVTSKTSSYTLTANDNNTVFIAGTSGITFTIPYAVIPTGSQITIINNTTGTINIKAASGVTLNGTSAGTVTITERYKAITLVNSGSTTFYAVGA